MEELPSGTVTFLFTDVEGSTRLLRARGEDYAGLLAEHRRLLRETFAKHGGAELGTWGDAFFVAFSRAGSALAAAADAHRALGDGPIRVRIGLQYALEPFPDEESGRVLRRPSSDRQTRPAGRPSRAGDLSPARRASSRPRARGFSPQGSRSSAPPRPARPAPSGSDRRGP